MATIVAMNATTYALDLDADSRIEIGDAQQPSFVPSIRAGRWGEVGLDFAFPTVRKIAAILQSGTSLSWESPQDGVRILFNVLDPSGEHETGGLDFDVILLQRPPASSITFTVNLNGLAAYYQPALTAGELASGFVRPDNVIGSYAFYHTGRSTFHGSQAAGEKYKTGKAFHLYRPRLTDALGATTWATLNLVGNTLTLSVDPAWLDAASYPVTIDPTFGYTSLGASYHNTGNGYVGYWQLDALSPAGGGTLTNFSLGLTPSSSSNQTAYGFYSESGSAPNSRLAYDSSAWTFGSTTKAFYTNSVAWSYTLPGTATQYWGASNFNSDTNQWWYDTGGSKADRYEGASFPSLPATASSAADYGSIHLSAYATYTSAAALDQLAARWRNDDADEANATWAADENANLTAQIGTKRVRLQINNTGDPSAITPQFDWRINAGTWRKIR